MILGIISVIIFIIGCCITCEGDDYDSIIRVLVGFLLIGLGLYFIFTFLGVNEELITSWFRI